jgi:ARG and Rhodanese-Phosphatase-superfamily-associated Protein domain
VIDNLFQLGEPVKHRGIIVAPLFPRRDPVARYLTLDEALPQGLRITETSSAGSVPELALHNPLADNVLLYDGEELVGAKQNRILNVTVLAAAKANLTIPVSCVEEGRWRDVSTVFATAPHRAHPELRRRKAEALAARPLARGVAQGEVWDSVRDKAARMGVHSPTQANADVFDRYRRDIRRLEDAFPSQPGQCGAVLALGDTLCLDYVSKPDAFARLWPKLRAGYLLDALERLDSPSAPTDSIREFVDETTAATVTRQPSVGLGEDMRLRTARVVGSGLKLDGELLQLSAFTSVDGGARAFGRIARPSQRR